MSAIATTPCPVCHGEMWDETTSRYYDPTKNRPIAKCKNKACKGIVWPGKNGQGTGATPYGRPDAPPAPAQRITAPMALGGPLPYEQEAPAEQAAPLDAFHALALLYRRCLKEAQSDIAAHHIDKLGGDVAGAVVAAAATLFIQACKAGRQ